jgi:transcriptional regulator with XRE-family HTH domain
MMTAMQCRAARGLIRWTQDDLGREAGVSALTVRNFESEKSIPTRATLDVIRRAFERADVEFTNGDEPGVKLRKRGKRK